MILIDILTSIKINDYKILNFAGLIMKLIKKNLKFISTSSKVFDLFKKRLKEQLPENSTFKGDDSTLRYVYDKGIEFAEKAVFELEKAYKQEKTE